MVPKPLKNQRYNKSYYLCFYHFLPTHRYKLIRNYSFYLIILIQDNAKER